MGQKGRQVILKITFNTVCAAADCEICGERTKTDVGYAVMTEDRRDICWQCTQKYAADLIPVAQRMTAEWLADQDDREMLAQDEDERPERDRSSVFVDIPEDRPKKSGCAEFRRFLQSLHG
jgi:hypothetical protein